jgi:hypothetical protein
MELIILLPAVACWIALARWPIRKVLLNVYLPAALLLPQYYTIRFPHLPPLTFADAAVLPLGAALAVKEIRNWRFAWMDVWVLLFAVSVGLSEGLSTVLANGTWRQVFSTDGPPLNTNIGNGGEELFACICTMVLPYVLGKLLIEQQGDEGQAARKRVVRRIAQLLAVVAGISVFDFVRRRSLWQIVGRHLFPDQPVEWPVQVRWGFGRIAGPYAHAIIAGMIFLTGLIYCLWLWRFAPNWGRRRMVAGVPVTVRGLILGAIVAGLLMTQSRGPWVGVGLALVLAALMRAFPMGRAVLIFALFLGVFTAGAYYYGKRYTDVDLEHARTEAQRDVVYRRLLVRTYMPLVRARKAFGWGYGTLPILNGQKSIDNQYLLVAAAQGLTGLGLFLLILAGSAVRLFRLALRPLGAEDRALVFAHMTVLLGLVTALTTVYLGEQAVLLFFLIVGWIHGMARSGAMLGRRIAPEFHFQKVLA